jgi:hypothetical protein
MLIFSPPQETNFWTLLGDVSPDFYPEQFKNTRIEPSPLQADQ